jgi:hypothetical protein
VQEAVKALRYVYSKPKFNLYQGIYEIILCTYPGPCGGHSWQQLRKAGVMYTKQRNTGLSQFRERLFL